MCNEFTNIRLRYTHFPKMEKLEYYMKPRKSEVSNVLSKKCCQTEQFVHFEVQKGLMDELWEKI